MNAAEKALAFVGGVVGGVGFAAGVWLTRTRLARVLHQNNHAVKAPVPRYDPVAEIVRSIENVKAAIARKKAGNQ